MAGKARSSRRAAKDSRRKKPRRAKVDSRRRVTRSTEAARKRISRRDSRVIATRFRKPKDAARRAACADSLRLFCLTYLAAKFYLPFSDDHLRLIERLEITVRKGGQAAIAMYRGGGKTELCKAAALWAILYGYRRFVVIVGATEALAEQIAEGIKHELENNDLIDDDFHEATNWVRRLEGIASRARFQIRPDGRPYGLVWQSRTIQLAAVPKATCSGAVIRTVGITGSFRGMSATGPDGATIRPDLVLCDDVQTRESAGSPTQTADREAIIRGDILGLAGPTKTIACLMPCTVIYPGDLSDRLLDRVKNPQWHGVRCKLVRAWPTARELWDRYFELRAESLRVGGDGAEAGAFYLERQVEMDAGADVSWPARFDPENYSSAIEEAEVKRHDNPREFAAEFQNEPIVEKHGDESRQLDESDLIRKLNNLERGLVPRECNKLTAFIDVQAECLFWGVCAWTDKFGGALIDYGVYPPQPVGAVFDAANPPVKLSIRFPKLERKARVYAALADLVPKVAGRAHAQDGADGEVSISLCLIDAGFETEAVHEFISRSALRPILKPSMGRAFKADSKPMRLYTRHPGDEVGHNWRIDAKVAGKGRYVMFNANAWKSFVAEAILAPAGATGSFYLPGKSLVEAQLLTLHLLSEYRIPTEGPWGRVEVWKMRPDRSENHWWDVCVGCAVGASVLKVQFSPAVAAGADPPPPKVKKPKRDYLAEFHAQAAKSGERTWG